MSGAMCAHRYQFARASGLLLGLIFAALSLAAQDAGPHPLQSRAARPLVTVKGVVTNGLTGEAIRRALVVLQGEAQRSMLTDEAGRFAFANVPAARGTMMVQRPGFFSPKERGTSVDLSSDKEIELKLMPAGLIVGRILGANDEPLERVPVLLAVSQISEGRRRWAESKRALTDEDGQFRFADLRPGSYKIAAGPVRSQDLASRSTGYAISYFPDAPDRNSGAPVSITAGQQFEANFKLRPVSVYTVNGSLAGFNGLGANIEFIDASNSPLPLPFVFDPRSARFTVPAVPSGRYTIRATVFEENGVPQRARASINVDSNISGLTLALQAPITIPVVVRSNFTKQDPYSRRPRVAGASVRLISNTEGGMDYFAQPDGPPEAGAISISNVEPGTYQVDIFPHGPWYVASAQCGARNLLREPLVVTAASGGEPIEIVLRDDTGTVEGSFRSGKESAVLAFADSEPSHPIHGYGRNDGAFYLSQLAPGSYTIYAFDEIDAVEYGNPEVLREYRSRAARVTVSPNQTAKVTVEVIATEP